MVERGEKIEGGRYNATNDPPVEEMLILFIFIFIFLPLLLNVKTIIFFFPFG